AEAEALDRSRVWPAVSQGIERHDVRVEWRRRLRTVPAWGVALAVAASVVLWVRSPGPEPQRVAARPRPNQTVIERIDSSGHFELRRERKNGTTLIMVSPDVDPAGQGRAMRDPARPGGGDARQADGRIARAGGYGRAAAESRRDALRRRSGLARRPGGAHHHAASGGLRWQTGSRRSATSSGAWRRRSAPRCAGRA